MVATGNMVTLWSPFYEALALIETLNRTNDIVMFSKTESKFLISPDTYYLETVSAQSSVSQLLAVDGFNLYMYTHTYLVGSTVSVSCVK